MKGFIGEDFLMVLVAVVCSLASGFFIGIDAGIGYSAESCQDHQYFIYQNQKISCSVTREWVDE